MFSAFYHDKLEKIQKEKASKQDKHLKSLSAQIQFREQLIENNRKRVEKRISDMASDPVPINRHEFRLNLCGFKGESFIRAKPKDSKERVRAAEQEGSWLDPIPLLSSPHDFRPRYKSKEINHYMKYTPKDRYERVLDTWVYQSNVLDHSWEVKEVKGLVSPKVFPNTLKKSYYKTLETEALALPPKVNKKTNLLEQDVESSKTERKLSDIAQEAMDKCKLRPLRDELASLHSVRSSRIQENSYRK